jgi:hypothetical protein
MYKTCKALQICDPLIINTKVCLYFRVHYSDAVLIVTPLSAKTKRNNTNIYTVTNLYGCWIKFYSLVNLICLRPRIKNVCVSGSKKIQHKISGRSGSGEYCLNYVNLKICILMTAHKSYLPNTNVFVFLSLSPFGFSCLQSFVLTSQTFHEHT